MHAILALQIAIRIITLDIHRYRFDTGLISLLVVGDGHLIAIALGPTLIHTHQHGGPILALCSSRSGVDLQDAAHLVGLFTQHVAELQLLHQVKRFAISLIQLLLADNLLPDIIIRQLQLLGRRFHRIIQLNPFLQLPYFLHLDLCLLGILPESGILRT